MALNLLGKKPQDVLIENDVTITWKDGTVHQMPFLVLRDACPCAACVDELTGKKVLDPRAIPKDIHVRQAEYVGNYGLRFTWSDGHNSGIYTFSLLRQLGEAVARQ